MRTAGETVTLGKSHIGQLRTAVGTGGQSTENLDGQERTSANTPTVSYARGQDLSGTLEGAGGIGGLLARSDQYSGGTWGRHVFYHADGNGNVTALIDSAQTVVAAYRYNPYGQLLGSSGSLAGVNTLRFSSKQVHPNVGLYYYGYRFYDSNLHRWLNRDPLRDIGSMASLAFPELMQRGHIEFWDTPNIYRYVYNNPIGWVDAYGPYTWREWLEIIGAGFGAAGQGLAAEIDGALPGNPMAGLGLYDPCEDWVGFSRGAGAVAASAAGTAGALRGAAWFGGTRAGHFLNHNPYLRIGPGRMPRNGPFPPNTHAPRISIGPQRPGASNPHLDLRIRPFDL